MLFVFLRTKLPFALILFTLSADLVSLSPPFPLIWLTFSIDIVSVCLPLSADLSASRQSLLAIDF
jgi:hypothetical protein